MAGGCPLQSEAKGTIVFAHGNAGNISSHLGFVYWLPKQGYNVFLFDYRGYGRSEGKPTAAGIVDDTQKAIAYAQSRTESQAGVVIYGHSLGGATSISALAQLDNRDYLKGVVIDSAFASYRDIARDKVKSHWLTFVMYPFIPLLITGEPVPKDLVQQLQPLPIYISHSQGDQVIPFEHGQRLYDKALHPKAFYQLKAQEHNHGWQSADDRRWFLSVLDELFSPASPIVLDLNQ